MVTVLRVFVDVDAIVSGNMIWKKKIGIKVFRASLIPRPPSYQLHFLALMPAFIDSLQPTWVCGILLNATIQFTRDLGTKLWLTRGGGPFWHALLFLFKYAMIKLPFFRPWLCAQNHGLSITHRAILTYGDIHPSSSLWNTKPPDCEITIARSVTRPFPSGIPLS